MTVWQYRVQVTTTLRDIFRSRTSRQRLLRSGRSTAALSNPTRWGFLLSISSSSNFPPNWFHLILIIVIIDTLQVKAMVQGRDRRPELAYKLALECRSWLIWMILIDCCEIRFRFIEEGNIQWVLIKVQSRWWMNSQWKHNFQRKMLNFLISTSFSFRNQITYPLKNKYSKYNKVQLPVV